MKHEDPQLADALRRSVNARELLTRIERVLSLPRPRITSDLTFPLRAIMAIERSAAQAWNILATVREPQPEQPAQTAPIPAATTESYVVDEGRRLINRIQESR